MYECIIESLKQKRSWVAFIENILADTSAKNVKVRKQNLDDNKASCGLYQLWMFSGLAKKNVI